MSQSTMTSDYFGHETAIAGRFSEVDGMLLTFVAGNAVLAIISLVLMFFLEDPWFAALVFFVTYTFFLFNLHAAKD